MWGRSLSVCFLKYKRIITFFLKHMKLLCVITTETPKERKRDFNCVCKGSKHLFSTLQLLYRRTSFSGEATAMGQRFLYQNDLIFQSIKSVISNRANTTIALHSAFNWAMFGVLLWQNWENDALVFLCISFARCTIWRDCNLAHS